MERSPKIRVVSATEAKNRFGEILKGAYQRAEHTVIERDGIPVAVFVPIQDYWAARTPRTLAEGRGAYDANGVAEAEARAELRDYIKRMYKDIPRYPDEEIEEDIRVAIEAVRGR